MADIELVIKIPEWQYRTIKENKMGISTGITINALGAIQQGIPLPKGHGDLIDQKDLAKSLYDYQWIDQSTYIEVTNRLINTPTIIMADKEQEDGNAD